MPLQTVDDFLAILEKSKLVSPNGLQQIRKATVEVADAKAVAKFLVSRGILTRFQATQLLAGRHALQLGPYRLLDRIASSGTGAVYAAQAAETKQPVSLKVLPRKLLEDKETLTKLKQQVGKLKSLDHPAFCRAIELRREGEQVVLVLEAVDGESLAQRVQTGGPLAFDTAGKYVRQVADALTAAHQQDLVHGDLTPHNLICDAEDQLKLIDVGTATLNPAGVSADYAAPEVSGGQPPAPASDVYSLGCTLYFLLTGKPPFPEGTAEEKRQKHADELPAGVLELRPDAPPELMKLCIRMMAKKPEQRPELAGAVAGVIDEWLAAAAASPADEAGADEAEQGELTETSDSEMTDPDVDRALAEAMAASDFDEHLDEPASEAAPPAPPTAAAPPAAAETAKAPADDVDDVLAEAMAASEFDHSMEDAEQTDQRKARLGDVSGSDDDLMDELDDDYEVESPAAAPAPPAADSAVATGGPKLLGLDLYRLLGVKEDDEPAAKKKKLIIGGVASGVIALGLVFAVVKFGLPMVFGESGKSQRRGSNRPRQVADRENGPPKPDTDPQPGSGGPEQPAETVVDGPDDGSPPGEAAPGETTPDGGGTSTDAAEEGGGATTPPEGTGDDTAEPGEGTDTTPAEPPGTTPGETPAEPPGEEANPLESLAAKIDLPREAGAGPVSLGPLKISPETECTAELIGAAETGVGEGTFTLKPTEIPQADRAWFVEMSAAGGAPVTIGGFIVKDGELTYQWNGENAANEPAQALRYLALALKCGTNEHVVALRTPRLEKPIVTEFDRDNMTAFVDVDWQGDPQLLFAQITELEGKFPGHEFKGGKSTVKAGGDKTVLMIGEGEPAMLAVMVDASLTDKLSLVLSPFFRLESEQKTLPFNSSTVNLWGNKLLKSLAEEKESLGTAKKREAEARGTQAERLRDVIRQSEEEIAATEASLALLKKLSEFAKATHKQGKIHFRVFYKLGESEVDLVQTQE